MGASPSSMGAGMGALGALGSGLGWLFGGNSNPADAAKPFFQQIPSAISPYYKPYMQAGTNALPKLQDQYNSLIGDPNAFYNKLASGYHESPGYQWQLGQGMNAANNAAAAGGMLGSPQHQQQASQMAEGLANQDFNNYLRQVFGMYGTGLSGEQGLAGMGANAGNSMAAQIAQALAAQGSLAYQGQAAQNQANGQGLGSLLGGLGSLASAFF